MKISNIPRTILSLIIAVFFVAVLSLRVLAQSETRRDQWNGE